VQRSLRTRVGRSRETQDVSCGVGQEIFVLSSYSSRVRQRERRVEGSTYRSDVHASASWFTAIASALVHVSRLCGSSLAMSGRFPVHGPGPW
jgi:hypothetical protein